MALQDGTDAVDAFPGAAMDDDGSAVLAGYTYGDFSGAGNTGDRDFAAVKLSADGEELWRWQVNIPASGAQVGSLEKIASVSVCSLRGTHHRRWPLYAFCS